MPDERHEIYATDTGYSIRDTEHVYDLDLGYSTETTVLIGVMQALQHIGMMLTRGYTRHGRVVVRSDCQQAVERLVSGDTGDGKINSYAMEQIRRMEERMRAASGGVQYETCNINERNMRSERERISTKIKFPEPLDVMRRYCMDMQDTLRLLRNINNTHEVVLTGGNAAEFDPGFEYEPPSSLTALHSERRRLYPELLGEIERTIYLFGGQVRDSRQPSS